MPAKTRSYRWPVIFGALLLVVVVGFLLTRPTARKAIGDYAFWHLNSDEQALVADFSLPSQNGEVRVYRFRTDKPFSTIKLLVDGAEQWSYLLGKGMYQLEDGASQWYPSGATGEPEELDEIEVRIITTGGAMTIDVAFRHQHGGRSLVHTVPCQTAGCMSRQKIPGRLLHLDGTTLVMDVAPLELDADRYLEAPIVQVVVEQ